MKFTRLAALVAVPAALALAACGGGSSATIANISGNTANLRIVNGATSAGAFDIYFQTTGSASPSQSIVGGLNYGVASDYTTQAAAGANVLVMKAGNPAPSTGAPSLASCPVPQLASNGKYSIVVVGSGTTVNCRLFQDFDYTGSPQIRVHDASANAPTTLGFGLIASSNAAIGASFNVLGTTTLGNLPSSFSSAFTSTQPISISPNASGSSTFAIGSQTSGTGTAMATLDSSRIFAPNGTTQPNSSGALNFTGSAGTSLFVLDCGSSDVTSLPGVSCTNGVALVGYTDRL